MSRPAAVPLLYSVGTCKATLPCSGFQSYSVQISHFLYSRQVPIQFSRIQYKSKFYAAEKEIPKFWVSSQGRRTSFQGEEVSSRTRLGQGGYQPQRMRGWNSDRNTRPRIPAVGKKKGWLRSKFYLKGKFFILTVKAERVTAARSLLAHTSSARQPPLNVCVKFQLTPTTNIPKHNRAILQKKLFLAKGRDAQECLGLPYIITCSILLNLTHIRKDLAVDALSANWKINEYTLYTLHYTSERAIPTGKHHGRLPLLVHASVISEDISLTLHYVCQSMFVYKIHTCAIIFVPTEYRLNEMY